MQHQDMNAKLRVQDRQLTSHILDEISIVPLNSINTLMYTIPKDAHTHIIFPGLSTAPPLTLIKK